MIVPKANNDIFFKELLLAKVTNATRYVVNRDTIIEFSRQIICDFTNMDKSNVRLVENVM